MTTKNKANRHFREYYESGCLCILTNKIKKTEGGDDAAAVSFYDENCTCSRHPESANRKCWDSLLTLEQIKNLLQSIEKNRIQ